MKRTLLTILSATTFAIVGLCQSTPSVGIRVSWDYTSPATNLPQYSAGSGISVGPLVNIPIYKSIYIEPGVNFYYDTMNQSYIDYFTDGTVPGPSGTVKSTGLNVPIMAGYRVKIFDQGAISVFTGPQINYSFTTKTHLNTAGKTVDANINMYDLGWRHVDAQWKLGLRFTYLDNFFAEISGGAGISNILDTDKANYKNKHLRKNGVYIGVGYMF